MVKSFHPTFTGSPPFVIPSEGGEKLFDPRDPRAVTKTAFGFQSIERSMDRQNLNVIRRQAQRYEKARGSLTDRMVEAILTNDITLVERIIVQAERENIILSEAGITTRIERSVFDKLTRAILGLPPELRERAFGAIVPVEQEPVVPFSDAPRTIELAPAPLGTKFNP